MEGTKTCPYCAEEVKEAAIVCKHCGSRFDGVSASARAQDQAPAPEEKKMPILGFVGLVLMFLIAPAACLFSGGSYTVPGIIGLVGAGVLIYALFTGKVSYWGRGS